MSTSEGTPRGAGGVPAPTQHVPTIDPRPDDAHKGSVGRVAIVAGSRGMSGAACLAGLGALRGGAGLVRVLVPTSAQRIVASSDPCLMTVPLPESDAGLLSPDGLPAALEDTITWADVLALGPGLGQSPRTAEAVQWVLSAFNGPMVIDADGLNNIASLGPGAWGARRGRATVLTPHPGEAARLRKALGLSKLRSMDDETRLRIAHELASATQTVVLLKGHRTVVCTATQTYINETGNPGMATGGMGDVLTGLLAALVGQGLGPFEAACVAAHCHGAAGDLCAKRIGPIGFLARDVAEALPAALAQVYGGRLGFR